MTVRSELTLRRMWDEANARAQHADKAAESAAMHEQNARSLEIRARQEYEQMRAERAEADKARAESADLADIVNEKRTGLGLPSLAPGDSYPADGSSQPLPVAGHAPPPAEYPPPAGGPEDGERP